MRFSAWSSRATLAWAASAALVSVAAARPPATRLSITPDTVRTGVLVDLVFSIPNEHDGYGINHVTLGVPQDFVLDDGEAKPGWTQSRSGQAITWSGGRIPRHEFGRFAIRGVAPSKPETVLFNVLVGDRMGTSTTYQVALEVATHGEQDAGARSLGRAALIVAIVAAGLALGAIFLGLYVWLRPPP
jgi:uncharacterized protein YcnI